MRKHFFHGDTLIEVAIAIGIFSLVAISIVAVINTSTSGIQTSLETTMARNEIDAQAEALRFIHDAYEAEKDLESSQQTYSALWKSITALATNNKNLDITDFTPTTCSALYEQNTTSPDYINSIFYQNAFIINPKLLNSTSPANALITANANPTKFTTTPLYPRIFNSSNDLLITEDLSNSNNNLLAQGFYIIPIPDKGTPIANDSGGTSSQIAYYDFYIRTCWYAAGADTPSTISTVVRLYSPDVVVIDDQTSYTSPTTVIYYKDPDGKDIYCSVTYPNIPAKFGDDGCFAETSVEFDQEINPDPDNQVFRNWVDKNGNTITADTLTIINPSGTGGNIYIYPKYVPRRTLTYYDDTKNILCTKKETNEHAINNSNSATFNIKNETISSRYSTSGYYTVSSSGSIGASCPNYSVTDKNGKKFQGWSENADGREPLYTANKNNTTITSKDNKYSLYLYPVWRTEISFNSIDWKTTNSNGKGTIQINNTSSGGRVIFTGHREGPVNVSVYYEIGLNDTFELSADMVTSGMKTHPGGHVEISIGPITAKITKPSDSENKITINYSCGSSEAPEPFKSNPSSDTVNIKINKYQNEYYMSLNGTKFITCNVSNYSNPIKVSYRMEHNSHDCSTIFNVTLKNIQMKRLIQD